MAKPTSCRRFPTRGCWPRGSRTRSSRSCRARATRFPWSGRVSRSRSWRGSWTARSRPVARGPGWQRGPSRSPAPSGSRSARHGLGRALPGSPSTGCEGGPMWRLTDEQRALREEIREIVREEIRPRVQVMEENCEYPRDLYELMAKHRLLGLGFPEEFGGRCKSEASWCAYVEELAKVSGTVSLMAAYVKLVSLPLLLAGTREQQEQVIPRLLRGEILGSFALSEPSVGSDPGGLQTRAEKRGDVWVLNGAKKFIGNAGLSDVYVVFARTGAAGPRGVSAFLVDGHAPGVSAEKLRTMGMPGWQLGAPRFEDVEVPAENLIGREGDGFKIAMATFDRSRPTVAAQAVGLGQGAIDLAVDYAVRRHAFGEPLLGHQGIQFKLAQMEAEIA